MNFKSRLGAPVKKFVPKSFSRTSAMIQDFGRAGIRATEGTLRLQTLLGNSASYQFAVNENQNSLITEIRLRQGDAFVATSIALFVVKAGSSTSPTNTELSYAAPHTFPNSTVFTGTNEARNLESIYQSRIQLTVNSVNVTETLDTLRYRRVGLAQQGVGLSTYDATNNANNKYLRSEWDGSDYGFQTFHQSVCFNGQANNQINLLLPSAVDCSGTSSANYVQIYLRGVLLINGANSVQDASLNVFNK
jgi:hypothetical protein